MSVIGAMMLAPRLGAEVATILTEADFKRPAHRILFRTLREMLEKEMPIDSVTLNRRLAEQENLEQIGGTSYLTELTQFVPVARNVAWYAEKVLQCSRLRQAEITGREIVGLAHGGGDAAAQSILLSAKSLEDRLVHTGVKSAEVDVKALVSRVLDSQDGAGHRSYFPTLDHDYCRRRGGLPAGQYTLFQALSGVGKTTAKLSLLFPALALGKRCVAATFADVDSDELMYRAIRFASGFAGRKSECRSVEERKRLLEAADQVYSWNWSIYDSAKSHGANTIEGFRLWLLRDIEKHGPPTRVMMDYAQRIATQNAGMMQSEVARNQFVSERVRLLASEVPDAAFLVGCQVTPKAEGREVRYVAKNASDWEENAAMRLLVERDKWTLKKNRYGVDGVSVNTTFVESQLVVREAAEE